ncbi:MAG TPA: ATP F0F1 synthase subunit B [Rhizomicrobium sp.]|nr:ATP F0F1 synthase subunit B [Rhizomicrobium sp.]
MMDILQNPELWVAIGFVIVIGILVYAGAPKMIGKMLDDRAIAIKAELDEAMRLRAEAEALLADYKRKSANAETEANAIVAEARADAERIAKEMRAALEAQIERRGKQAQDKIAQAEAAAMAEIRALAADAAAAAAEKLIAARLDEKRAGALVEQSLKDLSSKLN